jgi:hypothetical protein
VLRLSAAYEARDMSVKDPAKKSARLIKVPKEIHYPGGPHGFTATHPDQVNADLLTFLKSQIPPSFRIVTQTH